MHKLFTILEALAAPARCIVPTRSPWSFPSLLLLLVTLLWPPALAFAQALTPIATVATNIAAALQGPFAVAVATIGLIGCGFLALSGRMPWSAASSRFGMAK